MGETLKERISDIIEAFVAYYGEENREDIESKFRNTFYTYYLSEDSLNAIISRAIKAKSEELINKYGSEIGLTEDEKKTYLNNQTLEHYKNMTVYKYIAYKKYFDATEEEILKEKREDAVRFFKRYYTDVTIDNLYSIKNTEKYKRVHEKNTELASAWDYYLDDSIENDNVKRTKKEAVRVLSEIVPELTIDNIDDYIRNGKLDRIHEIAIVLTQALSDFRECEQLLEPNNKRLNDIKKRKEEKRHECDLLLIEEFRELFDEEEVEKFKNGRYSEKINAFLQQYSPKIESFSLASEELLKKDDWRKDSVLSDRIRFFKIFGIDLGNDYSAYENSPECESILPSQDVIEKFLERKEYYKRVVETDKYLSDSLYIETKKQLDSLNLICEDSFDLESLAYSYAFISPNLIIQNGEPIVYPLFYMSGKLSDEYYDNSIIHELNHRYELSLSEVREDSVEFLCGWDYLVQKNNTQVEKKDLLGDKDETKRDYELFNEIINELIAQEITTLMHERGIYIFNSPEFGKIKGATSYELARNLVQEFLNEFHSEIIASRKGNIDIIFDTVGKENFDALNELVKELHENFNIMSYGEAFIKHKKGEDTKDYIKVMEMYQKRDEILFKMREYSNSKII